MLRLTQTATEDTSFQTTELSNMSKQSQNSVTAEELVSLCRVDSGGVMIEICLVHTHFQLVSMLSSLQSVIQDPL